MNSERADKSMGVDHEDEIVLRSKEQAIELAETRRLLWLAVKEAGCAPGTVTIYRRDLPPNYELDISEKEHGIVTIAARTK